MPSCALEDDRDAARPGIDDEEHHRLFMLLLRAATAPRMRDEDFSREQEIAATLTDDDFSDLALRWREPQHCFTHTRSAVTCQGVTRDCPAKFLREEAGPRLLNL
jgi:hypothetical protein